jgi:hypothetical protein
MLNASGRALVLQENATKNIERVKIFRCHNLYVSIQTEEKCL